MSRMSASWKAGSSGGVTMKRAWLPVNQVLQVGEANAPVAAA
jgi:hypothetical protein